LITPKIVLSDFDGTLTDHTQLGPVFFDVIDFLKQRKIPLLIVTGRSLSWGHFLLTHVDYLQGVIVEGGGAYLWRDQAGDILEHAFVSELELARLEEACFEVKERYGQHIQLSADSFGRKYDRAIELRDLQKKPKLYQEIESFLHGSGINFSCSNVHLNFWAGDVSKQRASEWFLSQNKLKKEEAIYFGDSLNDQGMFAHFPHTVGVANIAEVLAKLNPAPAHITKAPGPLGVLERLHQIF
jgi:HAD superfamily hydrolase (TIGR01484 family)